MLNNTLQHILQTWKLINYKCINSTTSTYKIIISFYAALLLFLLDKLQSYDSSLMQIMFMFFIFVIHEVHFLKPGWLINNKFSDKTIIRRVQSAVLESVMAISKPLLHFAHYKSFLLQKNVVDDSLQPWDHISETQVKVKCLNERMLLHHWSLKQIRFSFIKLVLHTEQSDIV